MPKRTLAVIDGNSLLYRAFHALPTSMTAPDGRPTNAVYGYLSMLLKLAERFEPDLLISAFDKGKPAFRIEALERYKIHRPPTPDELRPQFGMVKELLGAMRVPVVELEGWEGDDILGTLAERGEAAGMRVLLFTGDKDALQLVTDNVHVVTTRKGISEITVYDPAGVEERLGVRPDQVADFLGLKGDTSDNIPGVPSVGEKTAAKLIQQYGSLDEVLAHSGEVPGRVGENLREFADQALVSRTVATIRRDVPVEVDLESATWGDVDADAVARDFGALRLLSISEKVLALGRRKASGAVGTTRPVAVGASDGSDMGAGSADAIAAALGCDTPASGGAAPWPVVAGDEAAAAVRSVIADGGEVAVALEDVGESLFPCLDLAFAMPDGRVAIVPADEAPAVLREALEGAVVASADVKALLHRFAPPGEGGEDSPFIAAFDPARVFDVGIAAYVLESSRSRYDVGSLYGEILGHAPPSCDDPASRMAIEAQCAAGLVPVLRERLSSTGSLDVYERIELPIIPVLARMEAHGVRVDTAVLAALSAETAGEIARLAAEIRELAGVDFNIDSPKQLGEVLFDKLGLPTGKRTKTGWSTDAKVLGGLAPAYPICAKVIEYRELAKLRSTYIEALPRMVAPDGRVHTTFNQTVAATGRLSSSDPNLQNIPVRSPLGQRIRAAFVPARDGDVMVSADYSQIELRVLAHLSGDEGLIAAFTSGEDFHTATASRVFGVEPDQLTPEHRRRAKAVNFGIVYGQTSHGLSESLGIGRAEAQEMIDRYFEAYPGVRTYLDAVIAQAKADGFASTMFGRRRPIPELNSSNYNLRSYGERTAMNHPMQGSAADIMKLAMIAVDARLRSEGLESCAVLQVHDEIVFEAPEAEVERLAELARSEMSGAAQLAVPIEVHVSWGADWAGAK